MFICNAPYLSEYPPATAAARLTVNPGEVKRVYLLSNICHKVMTRGV